MGGFMNIGTRLTAIGDLVPKNMKLADIGTDHAYLPTKLVLDGKIDYAIAGDIVKGPCEAAGRTVALYGLNEKIEVRQGSGLAILTPNEVDVATIAGMGGSTIISILEADMPVATALKKLILQPMAGTPSLRKWLTNNGWIIEKEVLIEENDHIYVCMSAARGEIGRAHV